MFCCPLPNLPELTANKFDPGPNVVLLNWSWTACSIIGQKIAKKKHSTGGFHISGLRGQPVRESHLFNQHWPFSVLCSYCFFSRRKLSLDILPLTQFPSLCCIWKKNTFISFLLLHHLSISDNVGDLENYEILLFKTLFPTYMYKLYILQLYIHIVGCLTWPNLVLQLGRFSNELNYWVWTLLMMVQQ